MLKNNKKGLSEIVGYTILIVIAISLSVLVYSFLKLYIPKEKITCEEDLKLIVQGYDCSVSAGELNLTITNKGLFKVDAVYVRFEDEAEGLKNQTNPDDFLLYTGNTPGLFPENSSYSSYKLENYGFSNLYEDREYELELQPAIIRDKKIIVCENALITQPIICN